MRSALFLGAVLLCGCQSSRPDSLAPVRRAALRVKAHTVIGVMPSRLHELLGDLSAELLVAGDGRPADAEMRALDQYTEALKLYLLSERLSAAVLAWENCRQYCDGEMKALAAITEEAKVDPGLDPAKRVHVLWRMAAQKIDAAK